jgi:hypothetical protein
VEVVLSGGLPGEQLPKPDVERDEVVVAAVGNRGGEVRPVVALEVEERRLVVRSETFESKAINHHGPSGRRDGVGPPISATILRHGGTSAHLNFGRAAEPAHVVGLDLQQLAEVDPAEAVADPTVSFDVAV